MADPFALAGRALLVGRHTRLTTHLLLYALVHLRQATHAFLNDLASYSTDAVVLGHLLVALPLPATLFISFCAITVPLINLFIPIALLRLLQYLVE